MKTLLHNLKLLSVLIYLVVVKIPSLLIISPIITTKRSIDRLIIWSHEVAHPNAEFNKNLSKEQSIKTKQTILIKTYLNVVL